jgi:hypothetical protein
MHAARLDDERAGRRRFVRGAGGAADLADQAPVVSTLPQQRITPLLEMPVTDFVAPMRLRFQGRVAAPMLHCGYNIAQCAPHVRHAGAHSHRHCIPTRCMQQCVMCIRAHS